ncbi:hypothetical protein [Pseudoalteromonas rhizosphaerae]|uniref:hypothetical protein n=1 Tax=Pseudoalteromonas rhizosphaerae TaxID=2518973 RepID=UPI00384DCC53
MNTKTAAEKMLETGLFYTPIELGREFACSTVHGDRCIKNMLADATYQIEKTDGPAPRYKMIAINGRKKPIATLQNNALMFKRPSLLAGG